MKSKLKKVFDFKYSSIKIKTLGYFLFFAICLIIAIWFLQIFFINNYYQEMKVSTTEKVASNIASKYSKGSFGEMITTINQATEGDDLLIRFEVEDGGTSYSTSPLIEDFAKELTAAKIKLYQSKENSISIIVDNSTNGRNTLIHAIKLDNSSNSILYVLAPLYPVQSTVNILQDQLVNITLIALLLALILSFFLSTKISLPIQSLTKSAVRLGEGEYGTTFETNKEFYEIENLANTLNKASLELEKSRNLQRDVMANVSHDLRTPLTMVKSYAELIRDISGDDPVKRNQHLQVIMDEADRLNSLVSDMLTITTMQVKGMELDQKDFNLTVMLNSLINTYTILEEQRDYKFKVNCRKNTIVYGDPDRLQQVISNLVSNAVKYVGDDKTIIINVKKLVRGIRCEVIDHGPGIPSDELSMVWDRYYKSSNNHGREATGTGLGLSIVKEILTLHKARFGVESKVGKGTTFWFELTEKNPNN